MTHVRSAGIRSKCTLYVVATQKANSIPAYDETAWAIWTYYRDNKHLLVSEIRDYRDAIVADILAGTPITTAFAHYLRPQRDIRKAA